MIPSADKFQKINGTNWDILGSLCHTAPFLFMVTDLSGNILFINRVGDLYRTEDVLGANLLSFVPPDRHPMIRAKMEQARTELKPVRYLVNSIEEPDVYFDCVVGPLQKEGGSVEALVFYALDVTSERREHEALQSIFASAPDKIFTLALDGSILLSNQGRQLKPSQTSYEGQNFYDLIPRGEGREQVALTLEKVKRTKNPARLEIQGLKFGDDKAWYELNIGPLRRGGKVYGFMMIVREDTDRRQALARSEEAIRVKSRFLANISHEIRTPLSAILGFSELLKEDGLSEQDHNRYISAIYRNGSHLLDLIDDLLHISTIDSGQINLNLTRCELADEVEAVKTMFLSEAKKRGLYLMIDCPRPLNVMTDRTRLRQILINLVGNGLKYSKSGGVKIVVEAGDVSGEAVIHVCDTGCGIDPTLIDQLFEPFTRSASPMVQSSSGTGLGLNLSRKLANLLGAELILERTSPSGSHFSLHLRLNQSEIIGEKLAPAPKSRPDSLAGRRYLIVEDCEDNQELIRTFLEQSGARAVVASDGKQGLGLALVEPYDVVFMDIQMPVMDGYQTVRALRENGYEGVIVALTAHSLIEERRKCLSSGFDHFLSKPVKKDILVNTALELSPA